MYLSMEFALHGLGQLLATTDPVSLMKTLNLSKLALFFVVSFFFVYVLVDYFILVQ